MRNIVIHRIKLTESVSLMIQWRMTMKTLDSMEKYYLWEVLVMIYLKFVTPEIRKKASFFVLHRVDVLPTGFRCLFYLLGYELQCLDFSFPTVWFSCYWWENTPIAYQNHHIYSKLVNLCIHKSCVVRELLLWKIDLWIHRFTNFE